MKLPRDPLLHFFLIGAILFGAFKLADGGGEAVRDEIVVTAGQIASLEAVFSRTWQRPPTAEELDGLVADHIRDEVLTREAVAMGLDRDDTVIRRRLRQKMEFVADIAVSTEPSDAELKAFVAEHAVRFRAEPRFSFSHVYFKAGRGGPGAAELEELLQALNAGRADASAVGDPFITGFDFQDLPRSDAAEMFGEGFAAWLEGSAAGAWAGPANSAYGTHLVRVSERVEVRDPPFAEIREAARREWLHARKIEANDALYAKLRKRYVIKVESASDAPAAGDKLAEAAP
jgi:hypothetical protein